MCQVSTYNHQKVMSMKIIKCKRTISPPIPTKKTRLKRYCAHALLTLNRINDIAPTEQGIEPTEQDIAPTYPTHGDI